MYLQELGLIALNLGLLALDIYLGFKVYEKYLLRKLRAERDYILEFRYLRVAGLHAKRVKAVNDKVSKAAAKTNRAKIVKIGYRVLRSKGIHLEKKAA